MGYQTASLSHTRFPKLFGYVGASMNQAIMQVPSVCILILQQAAFLAAEWEVVIQSAI